jgi:hypothetical protein
LAGTHTADQSIPLVRVVSKLDQESVEKAAPEWMTRQPTSKVNLPIRALWTLIYNGELSVNSPGARAYVTGEKAAVVLPVSIFVAREFLKRENVKLPRNNRRYDLLAQAEVVEANEDLRQPPPFRARGSFPKRDRSRDRTDIAGWGAAGERWG